MAITSVLELQLKADSLETAPEVIHATLTATRAFPGCLGVTVLVDSGDPAHVVLHESWESVEHDNAYRAWRATPEVPRPRLDPGRRTQADPVTVAEGI